MTLFAALLNASEALRVAARVARESGDRPLATALCGCGFVVASAMAKLAKRMEASS